MRENHSEKSEVILTLAEAATFLRVPEAELLRLVEKHEVPAQQIGTEWRFLKQALAEWLRYGRDYFRVSRMWPWMIDHPLFEDLLLLLEKRLLHELSTENLGAERGSKQAVLKHFAIFKDDEDLEKVLADIHARRKAASE